MKNQPSPRPTQDVEPFLAHICVIDRRYDRRIMGGSGISHTLCGAPRTSEDLLFLDLKRELVRPWRAERIQAGRAPRCVACIVRSGLDRAVCPDCGNRGPHDRNDARDDNFAWCCRACGRHFEPSEIL